MQVLKCFPRWGEYCVGFPRSRYQICCCHSLFAFCHPYIRLLIGWLCLTVGHYVPFDLSKFHAFVSISRRDMAGESIWITINVKTSRPWIFVLLPGLLKQVCEDSKYCQLKSYRPIWESDGRLLRKCVLSTATSVAPSNEVIRPVRITI